MSNKAKASWDISSTKVLIDCCLEQVNKGRRRGGSLNKDGWKEVAQQFAAKTGRVYDKGQFKNKYDAIRKEWQLWERLLNETGVGWDSEKRTIIADDEWWEKKLAEVPGYEKFRNRGLQFQEELSQLFSSVAATGKHQWAPSSMSPPIYAMPEDDMQEGSGDSDEVLGASTGLSGGFNSFTFNNNSGGSGGNTDKGKRTSGGDKSSTGYRTTTSLGVRRKGDGMKKKGPASAKIADALSRIADTADIGEDNARADRIAAEERAERLAAEARAERMAAEERAERLAEEARVERRAAEERAERMAAEARAERMAAEQRAYEISIAGVMNHLNQVHEVISDNDFYMRCVHLLMRDPPAREMYAAIKNMRDKLLMFLRQECYGRQ